MDHIFDDLCSSDVSGVDSLNAAQSANNALEQKLKDIDESLTELTNDGDSLLKVLKKPETNSLGHEITRDYLPGIVHIRNLIADAHARRKRCSELVDVRKLKLQQLLQLFTCEKDGEQALKWIEELRETLNRDYTGVPLSRQEAADMRADQLKLEQTARSTYDYGRQLCQVSLVLRRSLRMGVSTQTDAHRRLEAAWARFCRALSEHTARLSLTTSFFTTAKQVKDRLDDMCTTTQNDKLKSDRDGAVRRKFNTEIRELRHMAEALVDKYDSTSPVANGVTESSDSDATLATKRGVRPAREEILSTIGEIESKRRILDSICSSSMNESQQTASTASTLLRNLRLDDTLPNGR